MLQATHIVCVHCVHSGEIDHWEPIHPIVFGCLQCISVIFLTQGPLYGSWLLCSALSLSISRQLQHRPSSQPPHWRDDGGNRAPSRTDTVRRALIRQGIPQRSGVTSPSIGRISPTEDRLTATPAYPELVGTWTMWMDEAGSSGWSCLV